MQHTRRQELRLSRGLAQNLAMTPQLQQAIRLLQLSHLELADFVARQLDENPLLRPVDPYPLHGGGRGSDEDWLQQLAQPPPDLRGYLLQQLGQSSFTPLEQRLAVGLIDALDEDGYLRVELQELADDLRCPQGALEALLRRLQQFEPTGIFARDLRECLALQLAERDRLDPAMARLLDHLPLLARQDWAGLEHLCGVGRRNLQEMAQELRTLAPRPGAAFAAEPVVPLVPDLLVRSGRAGGWKIELNPEALPRILVDRSGYQRLLSACRSTGDKAYLAERLQAASWLERALRQRAMTLRRAGEALLHHQEPFFDRGAQALRPLTRRELAATLGVHESTISRVTANKYLASPGGTFPLRYFFGNAVAGAAGEAHAAQSIRHRIGELVQAEAAATVLSDDAIVSQLAREGVQIARRTVAKYRKAMKIPSSAQRRRLCRVAT